MPLKKTLAYSGGCVGIFGSTAGQDLSSRGQGGPCLARLCGQPARPATGRPRPHLQGGAVGVQGAAREVAPRQQRLQRAGLVHPQVVAAARLGQGAAVRHWNSNEESVRAPACLTLPAARGRSALRGGAVGGGCWHQGHPRLARGVGPGQGLVWGPPRRVRALPAHHPSQHPGGSPVTLRKMASSAANSSTVRAGSIRRREAAMLADCILAQVGGGVSDPVWGVTVVSGAEVAEPTRPQQPEQSERQGLTRRGR